MNAAASTWAGWSNRHYPCAIVELDVANTRPSRPSILIAVRREPGSVNARITVAVSTGLASDWTDRQRASGANELHVYELAANDTTDDILADLGPKDPGRVAIKGGGRSNARRAA